MSAQYNERVAQGWGAELWSHPLQFLDIRGLHIPQSMAKANLILRSIEMTLERELPAPLGAEVWWCSKFSFWTFWSQKHQLKISGLYFGRTDELEHLFCLLLLPAIEVELPWPMSSSCGASRQRLHSYSCRQVPLPWHTAGRAQQATGPAPCLAEIISFLSCAAEEDGWSHDHPRMSQSRVWWPFRKLLSSSRAGHSSKEAQAENLHCECKSSSLTWMR